MLFDLEEVRDVVTGGGALDDDERRVVRDGGLTWFSRSSLSVLSPLDRFRLEGGSDRCGGGLFSGSTDNLEEERVERRGGICMRLS